MAQYHMTIPLKAKTMKVETHIDQPNNNLYNLRLLNKLYSSNREFNGLRITLAWKLISE